MIKNLLFFLVVGVSSLVLSSAGTATVVDTAPETTTATTPSTPTPAPALAPAVIPQDTTALTPSDEAFRYAPQAAEVFLEAKARIS